MMSKKFPWPGYRCEYQYSNRYCGGLANRYYHIYGPDERFVVRCGQHLLSGRNIETMTESEYEVALILHE